MNKTLGGDRLGSGKKMNVHLHGYERSTHDLGYIWRSTMAAGTLVPFLSEPALPGDTFDINLDCIIKTHPTVGPLFGSFKVQLDIFQAPIRLYNAKLHNNKLGIGLNMAQIKLPVARLTATQILSSTKNLDNAQINPSSILAYLGLRGVGKAHAAATNKVRQFQMIPLLAVYDIYKNYYANKQEGRGYFLHTPPTAMIQQVTGITVNGGALAQNAPTTPRVINAGQAIIISHTGTQPMNQIWLVLDGGEQVRASDISAMISDTGGAATFIYAGRYGNPRTVQYWRYATESELDAPTITLQQFDLTEIDQMREAILADVNSNTPFVINDQGINLYDQIFEVGAGNIGSSLQHPQEGLPIKTYQSDLFNNWLETEWIDGAGGISEVTAIDTTGGSFTLDTLNLSKKVYDMLNRIAVSGGSYDDWLDAVYDHPRYLRAETPMYMGGLIKELVFQEVVSNSSSSPDAQQGSQPLGTLAGKGIMGHKHKGGHIVIKVDEPSYIIGLISLTPRIDYSQGNKWDVNLQTLDDFHKPALDEIGFQELIIEQMAWWNTNQLADGTWQQHSAGKQPAWINYMTNVNQIRGNFAVETNEMFMVLNRRYTPADNGDTIDVDDLTTYIDPAKYNHIFAETARDSQNFWTQIAVDITARRKMSAKLMPNL